MSNNQLADSATEVQRAIVSFNNFLDKTGASEVQPFIHFPKRWVCVKVNGQFVLAPQRWAAYPHLAVEDYVDQDRRDRRFHSVAARNCLANWERSISTRELVEARQALDALAAKHEARIRADVEITMLEV